MKGLWKKILLSMFLLVNTLFCFAQEYTFDEAINDYTSNLVTIVPKGSGIAIIAFESDKKDVSIYFFDTMMEHIWKKGNISVYERYKIETLQKELDFSLTGRVSDETAQKIGHFVGVGTIIYGSMSKIGNSYRMAIRASEVESGRVLFPKSYDLRLDSRLAALLGISDTRWADDIRNEANKFAQAEQPAQTPGPQPVTITEHPQNQDQSIPKHENWQNHWIWLGFRTGGNIQTFTAETLITDNGAGGSSTKLAFIFSIQLSLQLWQYFAIQTEGIITLPGGPEWNEQKVPYQYQMFRNGDTLTIPVLAKLTFKPGTLSIQPFAGIYVTLPMGNIDYDYSIGALGSMNYGSGTTTFLSSMGFIAGGRVGIGFGFWEGIFLDLRYGFDFEPVIVSDYIGQSGALYRRKFFSFAIGMEIGLIKK